MIAKNGISTLVARVDIPFLAIMAGRRALGQRKIAVLASKTALSAANGAKTAIFTAPARTEDTTGGGAVRGPEAGHHPGLAQGLTNPVNLWSAH